MKKMIAILSLAGMAWLGIPFSQAQDHEHPNHKNELHLDKGAKWKADATTLKNVASLANLAKTDSLAQEKNRQLLVSQMRTGIDLLVKECTMKGEGHDVLHAWLMQVTHAIKEVSEPNEDFYRAHAALKRNIDNFYTYFE